MRTEVSLPGLDEVNEPADVEIVFDTVPETLEATAEKTPHFEAANGRLLLKFAGHTRVLVSDGIQAQIETTLPDNRNTIQYILLGSVMGAILHQRGALPLHASAVCVDGVAVAFLGHSGAGKSTLATALHRLDYPLLSDDVCALDVTSGSHILAYPGYPHVKLWRDAMEYLDLETESGMRIHDAFEKYALPVAVDGQPARKPVPVKRLYVLNPCDEAGIRLETIKGGSKITMLRQHTFRHQFLRGLRLEEVHFSRIVTVARNVPLVKINRPTKKYLLTELIDTLREDWKTLEV